MSHNGLKHNMLIVETHAAPPMATMPDPATWLDQHGNALYAYALMRVRETSVAEDLVQDTLLAAIMSVDRFKGESSERTWLIGILKHKVLDHLRQLGRVRRLDESMMPIEGEEAQHFDDRGRWRVETAEWSNPERSLEREEFWQTLQDCIGKLPDRLAILFTLRELDGMETDALMETLNISRHNNVWVMLSRARQRMRQCLETNWINT